MVGAGRRKAIEARLRAELAALRREVMALRVDQPPSEPFDWLARAERAEQARASLNAAAVLRGSLPGDLEASAVHALAAGRCQAAIEAAYPIGFHQQLDRLQAGDREGLPLVLAFLEADPYVFGSGYAKERALRALKRITLTNGEVDRLRRIVIAAVEGPDQRTFHAYRRLAGHLDGQSLQDALTDRLSHPAERGRRHARWVRESLEQHRRTEQGRRAKATAARPS